MMPALWKYTFASVVGTSHTKTDAPCQDASACCVLNTTGGDPVLVAIAADGAGSASRAEVGSALACDLFINEMHALFESGGALEDLTRDFAIAWVAHFHNEVTYRADAEGLRPRDFACTLLAAVVGAEMSVFLQIGDGAIVISESGEPDEYTWVFWPQKGEFANITTFATDEAASEHLEYSLVPHSIHEVALFTDGLERLALKFDTQEAHAPFFIPMFNPLRRAPEGHAENLSTALESFLNSQQINDRTDDDKTLILATRRVVSNTANDATHVHVEQD
jgi:hypothetical protein